MRDVELFRSSTLTSREETLKEQRSGSRAGVFGFARADCARHSSCAGSAVGRRKRGVLARSRALLVLRKRERWMALSGKLPFSATLKRIAEGKVALRAGVVDLHIPL